MSEPDKYFQVLGKIQELNAKNEPSTFTAIIKELPNLSRLDIHKAIDVLSDWSMIHGEYTVSSHVCRYNYYIDELAPIEYQPSSIANESLKKSVGGETIE